MVCISFNILLFNRGWGGGLFKFFIGFLLVGGGNFVVLWVEQFFAALYLIYQRDGSNGMY